MRGRLAAGGVDTDENLAVMKSDHVGRGRIVHELPMHPGNDLIGNEADLDFLERTENRFFSPARGEAQGQRRESLPRKAIE